MKKSIIFGIMTIAISSCGGTSNSTETATESEPMKEEIQILDSIAKEAESATQDITAKAKKLDSLINNLDN